MRIFKQKKNNIPFLLLTLFIFLLFYLFKITPGLKGDLEQSLRILLSQPVLFKTEPVHQNKIIDYSTKLFHGIVNKYSRKNEFENIKIDINFSELEKLKKDREKSLYLNKLVNPQKVKINLLFQGKEYKATARLKGDLKEHWANIKQWSLRIKLNKNRTILGFNEFSISIHSERDYPNYFVISEIFRENQILTPRYETVKVNFNGENWGIMLLEEQFSDSFYAHNKLKEAPIFKMTNENDFTIRTIANQKIENIDDIIKWQGKLETKVYNEKRIFKKTNIPDLKTNLNLLSIFKNVQETVVLEDERYFEKIKDHLDVNLIAKIVAITSIFGDYHSRLPTNSRYYVNPYNLKIEPILTDTSRSDIASQKKMEEFMNGYNILYKNFFHTKDFQKKYFQVVNEYKNNFSKIKKKFDVACQDFGKNCKNLVNLELIKQNIDFITKEKDNIFQNLLDDNQKIKKKKFNTLNIKNLNDKKIHFRAFDDGTIFLNNLTSETLRLDKIIFENVSKCKMNCKKIFDMSRSSPILNPSTYENLNLKKINVNLESKDYDFLEIRYLDQSNRQNSVTEKLEKKIFKKDKFFENENNIKSPIMSIKGNSYILDEGIHIINDPIIIPNGYDFIIKKGSTLKMSKESYILLKGGSIKMDGAENYPITISSANPKEVWKGIYVNSDIKDDNYSNLNFVNISNFSYFDNGKIQLTGGLNFIKSKVKISNSIISNSISEDAINFVKSEFKVSSSKFNNTISDAIDIDFGNGEISNTTFDKVGGDAIDLSGSDVYLKDINAKNVFDKAVSAGEQSNLKINNLQISSSGIGIASKDSSKVYANNIKVTKCNLYDFAVYQKKPYFRGAYLKIDQFSSCNLPLVQIGSDLILDDNKVKGIVIDIKKLYN